jgi:hypothetical protein
VPGYTVYGDGLWIPHPGTAEVLDRAAEPAVGPAARLEVELTRVKLSLVLVLAFLTCLTACEEEAVTPPTEKEPAWWLEPDSMNLGILVLDYLSYDLKGGRVDHYAPCDTCDRDSLPFEHIFEPPMDIGSVTFRYTETGETLLYASVIYIGNGYIEYPAEFLPPTEFKRVKATPDPPASFEYFQNGGKVAPFAEADTAWSRVWCTDLVESFALSSYRVGIYKHTARSGSPDPALDSWVVFVHQGRSTSLPYMDSPRSRVFKTTHLPLTNLVWTNVCLPSR